MAVRVEDGDGVRVVLLRGANGQFTTGLDLEEIGKAAATAERGELWSRKLLYAVAGFPKPVVCAIDRYALDVGCTVLLLCDLVYAAEGTVFRAPFVPMGLVPEAASTALLPRAAGHAVASEILLFGELHGHAAARAGALAAVMDAENASFDAALARLTH